MAGKPATSGTDNEGKDAKGNEEGADDRPDHSPSDAARGERAGSGDEHGPSERPHSQGCWGALLLPELVHEVEAWDMPMQAKEKRAGISRAPGNPKAINRGPGRGLPSHDVQWVACGR
jgi:hypothetical protein